MAQAQLDPVRAVEETLFEPGAKFESPFCQHNLLVRADFGHAARIEHRPAATNAHALRHGLLYGEADGLLLIPARVFAPALGGIDSQPRILVEIGRQEHELP